MLKYKGEAILSWQLYCLYNTWPGDVLHTTSIPVSVINQTPNITQVQQLVGFY